MISLSSSSLFSSQSCMLTTSTPYFSFFPAQSFLYVVSTSRISDIHSFFSEINHINHPSQTFVSGTSKYTSINMARAFFLAACFASALLSHVSGEMMERSEQYEPGQQGQQINGQQMGGKQMSGEQMGSTHVSEPKGKNGDMQGDKGGNGGGNTVIIIATNAGGSSQTQQMNAAVQPPQATHTV